MNLLRKYEGKPGYSTVAGGKGSTLKLLELGILNLKTGESFDDETGERELGAIILQGTCSISGSGFEYANIGKRRGVFGGRAFAAYIPIHTKFRVSCLENCEIALCHANTNEAMQPVLVKDSDVITGEGGVLNWRREVHSIIDERINVSKLCIGEAFNYPGNWSSFPPHKHDVSDLPVEGVMEEIYFFRFNMEQGFGYQAVYTDDKSIDEIYRVENNHAVEIARGYHPYVGAPGYYGYLLWIMAGEKRGFYRRTEPKHAWIDASEVLVKKNMR
ncbi:MAG: 5-deoxy-glucuronate isomerase [Spirochaetales bacterium]|nr:5-deoxy-glucuronate isomerase [Spirochaetales bacterium]